MSCQLVDHLHMHEMWFLYETEMVRITIGWLCVHIFCECAEFMA